MSASMLSTPSQADLQQAAATEWISVFDTDLGWMGVRVTAWGVRRVVFDCESAAQAELRLEVDQSEDMDRPGSTRRSRVQSLEETAAAVRRDVIEYARGGQPDLTVHPLDLGRHTPFQAKVIRACRRIAYGQTRSYGKLAAQVGAPRAARAVGTVMAKNRWPLLVPCHRVVGSNGALHGFSSRSGLSMKHRLLTLETNVA